MTSHKRRRAINIDVGYIEELRIAAKRLGMKTPTGVASKIFVGDAKPFSGGIRLVGKFKSVSMTEAMWLSIRERAHATDKNSRMVAQDLLRGAEPPLAPQEVERGLARAREREARRAAGDPEEEAPIPKPTRPAPPKEEVGMSNGESKDALKEMEAAESEARKKSRSSLSKGHPADLGIGDRESDESVKPGEEFYGGVFSF